jgi:hypothetical protein
MTDSDKLTTLRAQADKLGVKYHHRANAKTIEAAINADFVANNKSHDPVQPDGDLVKVTTAPVFEAPISEAAFNQGQARFSSKVCGSLMRVRIQNMNPQKKEWPGEIISVGSAKLGTFKKYIPFGSGEPYHIPKIIYDVLKDKKCSSFYTVDEGKGHKRRKSRLINEYVIEDLDPLTREELKDLALKQAMAAGKEA